MPIHRLAIDRWALVIVCDECRTIGYIHEWVVPMYPRKVDRWALVMVVQSRRCMIRFKICA